MRYSDERQRLVVAVTGLAVPLAEAMRLAIDEPGARIGAGEYESELARCPVAAAVDYGERHGMVPPRWDPAWGTRDEFGQRVESFIEAFDGFAEGVGLNVAVAVVRAALERRRLDQPDAQTVGVRERELDGSARL